MAINADRFLSMSWLGFSASASKAAPTPLLPSAIAPPTTTLAQRSISMGLSNPAKAAIVAMGVVGAVALSPLPRLLSATTNPLFAALSILGYIVYKLGQLVQGKVSPQGLLNLLGLAMKTPATTSNNKEPRIEEIVEETPAQKMAEEFLQTEQRKAPPAPVNKMVEEFLQPQSRQERASAWVAEYNSAVPEPQFTVKQFEQFNAGQDLADEFVNSETKPTKPESPQKLSPLEERHKAMRQLKARGKIASF